MDRANYSAAGNRRGSGAAKSFKRIFASRRSLELNPPSVMRARLGLVFAVATGLGAVGLIVGATWMHHFWLSLAGMGGFLLALGAWLFLRSRAAPEKDEAWAEFLSGPVPAGDPEKIGRLVDLLRTWDSLEHRRGSADFDPWELQAVRHDIREAVAEDPELERLFHT